MYYLINNIILLILLIKKNRGKIHMGGRAEDVVVEDKENKMADAEVQKTSDDVAIKDSKGGKGKKGDAPKAETGGMSDELKSALAAKISNLQEKQNEEERVLCACSARISLSPASSPCRCCPLHTHSRLQAWKVHGRLR